MEKIKIYLRRGYHSVYDELIRYPPEGVEYILPKFVTSSDQFGFINILRRKTWRLYANLLKKPNSIFIPITEKIDLIHSGSGFLIKNKTSWVVDLEHVASFVGFEANLLGKVKNQIGKILSLKFCKKIMPWTKAAKKSIINALDSKNFLEKIEVVYPAIFPIKIKKQKHDKINLLFVAYDFFVKGGKEVLEVYDKLKEKYDITLTVISNVPDYVKEKYNSVNFLLPKIPRQILMTEYFAKADIFVLPSYSDTFGMLFLESMAASVPIVTTNTFAVSEIIGKAGFTINATDFSWYGKNYLFVSNSWKNFCEFIKNSNKPKIVNQFVDKISILIEDATLRNEMGKFGRKEIEKGKFSIENRNKQLKRIYEEAVK